MVPNRFVRCTYVCCTNALSVVFRYMGHITAILGCCSVGTMSLRTSEYSLESQASAPYRLLVVHTIIPHRVLFAWQAHNVTKCISLERGRVTLFAPFPGVWLTLDCCVPGCRIVWNFALQLDALSRTPPGSLELSSLTLMQKMCWRIWSDASEFTSILVVVYTTHLGMAIGLGLQRRSGTSPSLRNGYTHSVSLVWDIIT